MHDLETIKRMNAERVARKPEVSPHEKAYALRKCLEHVRDDTSEALDRHLLYQLRGASDDILARLWDRVRNARL